MGGGVAVRVVGTARLLARICGGDEFSQAADVGGALWAGEEAVVADAMEAVWQHVQEEAADELGGVERHRLYPSFVGRLAAGKAAIAIDQRGVQIKRCKANLTDQRRRLCPGSVVSIDNVVGGDPDHTLLEPQKEARCALKRALSLTMRQ